MQVGMKIFIKWTLSFLGAGLILGLFYRNGNKSDPFPVGMFFKMLLMAIVIGSFMTYIQVKVLPKRYKKICAEIVRLFGAEQVDATTFRCRYGNVDLYIRLHLNLSLLKSYEGIGFHIPKSQISKPEYHRWFKFTDDRILNLKTYRLSATTMEGLELMKSRLDEFFRV